MALLCPEAGTWLGLCSGVLGKGKSPGAIGAMGTGCLVGAREHPSHREEAGTVGALQSRTSAALRAPGRAASLPSRSGNSSFPLISPEGCVGCSGGWMCAPASGGDRPCAPSAAPAALGWPCARAGFGGRVGAWPTAQAKAVQSGVETMRQVQSLPSSFSRTKFACIPGG